jgi:formylglycine-generating enzyme required for sulfatase activity
MSEPFPAQIGLALLAVIFVACTADPSSTAAPPPATTITPTGTPLPTPTPFPTPIPIPVEIPSQIETIAYGGIPKNNQWQPYIVTINGIEMALVPVGCFMMGGSDADEAPAHEVCFEEPFWIDVYEVTNAQFGSSGQFDGDDRPREMMSWNRALAYCESRGARLPTEAEWEYAARGPDSLVYPWGNEFVADNVVYFINSENRTWDVGSRPQGVSWIGAYNLSGNVWEWVNDWYGAYSESDSPQINPQGPQSGTHRVLRGGSWLDRNTDAFRAPDREYRYPELPDNFFGFRCARSY